MREYFLKSICLLLYDQWETKRLLYRTNCRWGEGGWQPLRGGFRSVDVYPQPQTLKGQYVPRALRPVRFYFFVSALLSSLIVLRFSRSLLHFLDSSMGTWRWEHKRSTRWKPCGDDWRSIVGEEHCATTKGRSVR